MSRYAIAIALCFALLPMSAGAAEFEVKMLSKGIKGEMVFEPDLVRVAPGDTIHFVAVNAGHDAVSIPGMLPEGAAPFKGEIDEDLTVTFTVPGVYGYKCSPHYSMYGMVGVVVVGEPVNLEAVRAVKVSSLARKRFEAIFSGL